MTIQDLGAIGDLIGGIAVVASFIYLAVQIRQNTQHVRAQMGHDGWLQNADELITLSTADGAGAFARVEFGGDSPTAEDLRIIDLRYRAALMHMGRVEHMTTQGLQIYSVDEAAVAYADYFNCATGRAWLDTHAAYCNALAPSVIARMRVLIEEQEATSEVDAFADFRDAVARRHGVNECL